jgi:hypothetical protein
MPKMAKLKMLQVRYDLANSLTALQVTVHAPSTGLGKFQHLNLKIMKFSILETSEDVFIWQVS